MNLAMASKTGLKLMTASYQGACKIIGSPVPRFMALQRHLTSEGALLMPTDHRPTGSCTLVGAGPGDPELLTVKAVKAIGKASIVLVDDLVSDAIVALAPARARVIKVGKRGGCPSTSQAFIERLMVTQARQGEQVVRLKGGDPFIFGRGGEELERLRQAGIEAQAINGITAGLAGATSLGVPLTHREHAHGVVFLTGHARPGAATDWPAIAQLAHRARLTLVIYMGVGSVAQIADGLSQGLPACTPAAVVQDISLPSQRHLATTLTRLASDISRHGIRSPSVVVVGDVTAGLAQAGSHPDRQAQLA
jgi:uroporphyrin-III C-methyltransferase